MTARSFSPGKLSLSLAASSVLSALGVLFLWKSGAFETEPAYLLTLLPVALVTTSIATSFRKREKPPSASHRYLGRMAIVMAFYLVTLFLAEHWIDNEGLIGPLALILALLPGLSFAGVVWIFGGLIVEEKDEFYRMLFVRQGLIATAISFTLAAVWGFLETYGQVEPVAAFWWPTIWCFGLGIGGVFNKIKYGTFGEIR
ncbi:hypothetical protein FGU71_04860 [Erythrobacter insulae]|uniref:Uncharacterized protein n=1 Tax=Erythrobacter insulae TaxID=2584124 RepID=A0A547PAT0_9SPHN|nr:hypothetical protein [Erythrobacter insulae]TRD11245.1 hypothetical protein FGU71_04860 [Erythrobacter insulae]